MATFGQLNETSPTLPVLTDKDYLDVGTTSRADISGPSGSSYNYNYNYYYWANYSQQFQQYSRKRYFNTVSEIEILVEGSSYFFTLRISLFATTLSVNIYQ